MDRHDYWYYSRHINNGSSCPWELGFRLVWIRVREEERGGVMEGGMDTCVKAFVKSLSTQGWQTLLKQYFGHLVCLILS